MLNISASLAMLSKKRQHVKASGVPKFWPIKGTVSRDFQPFFWLNRFDLGPIWTDKNVCPRSQRLRWHGFSVVTVPLKSWLTSQTPCGRSHWSEKSTCKECNITLFICLGITRNTDLNLAMFQVLTIGTSLS